MSSQLSQNTIKSSLSPEVLAKAHSLQLYILKVVRDICKKHDIPFFLYFGTLLGAIRHNGFIPWDDDLDIGMKREAFDHFLQIAPQVLPDNLLLQHWSVDRKYGHLFAKVSLLGTNWSMRYCENIHTFQGIYIDIFPFDLIPSLHKEQRKHYKMAKSLTRLMRLRCDYELPVPNAYLRLRNKLIAWRSKSIPYESIENKIHNMYTFGLNHADSQAPLCTAIGENYYGTMIPYVFLNDLQLHQFEDDAFPIPSKYDEILRRKYGDYNSPHPDKRVGHDILKYDFGIYQNSTPQP